MNKRDISTSDAKLILDHGFGIDMSVQEARSLFNDIPDDADTDYTELTNAIDEAQGAVHSESAGQAYIVIFINP